jgi:hypothetical protein
MVFGQLLTQPHVLAQDDRGERAQYVADDDPVETVVREHGLGLLDHLGHAIDQMWRCSLD